MAIARVAVVIPAHDEAELIGACLGSVRAALAHPAVAGLERLVVVAADACRDGTVERARAALGGVPGVLVLEVGFRNVGRARAAGVDAALRRFATGDPRTVWLGATDADTTVPPDWLARQLAAERGGYVAVAGIVDVESFPGQGPVIPARFRATYHVPEAGAHPHVHGCNVGVRADAYLDAGGWPPVALAEDHGLWKALQSRGWPCLSDRWLEVITSGRRFARARGGFADALTALGAGA